MVFIAVLVGVAVLGGLAVVALRRRGSDEMHSVTGYRDRLDRLEEIRQRQLGSVRVVRSISPRGENDPSPPLRRDGMIEISTSNRRVIDEDTEPNEPAGRPPPPVTYRRGRRDTSIARMNHRSRRLGAPIAAAVAVIALVTGLAIAGAHSRPPHSTTTTTLKKGVGGTTKRTHETTTTTTVPASFSPSSTSGTDVTYTLPFPSYTVTFKATTGSCYIQITNSSGSTPYAAVLNQGSTEQIVLSGTSKATLGRPSDVTVEVDRIPVDFPNPLPVALNITFAGEAPSSTSTT
jgi:hypothetical protein